MIAQKVDAARRSAVQPRTALSPARNAPVTAERPVTTQATTRLADLRAGCEAAGVALARLDMMIAAHAKEAGAMLVTRDRAFARVPDGSMSEDWSVVGRP